MNSAKLLDLMAEAKSVLEANWRGKSTIPSRYLYPHQWSWDSAFTAIGLSHLSQQNAQLELDTLFAAQWADGRIPHIVFNPEVSPREYFPSSDFWQSSSNGGPSSVETSGIVQPPIHARAALDVFRNARDLSLANEFLVGIYPKLVSWHDYLFRNRLEPGTKLVLTLHPWESGLDNSPLWDQALEGVTVMADVATSFTRRDLQHVDKHDRPSDDDYSKFVQIATDYRDSGYNDFTYVDSRQYAVVDPMFNALLAWSEEALGGIATAIGLDGTVHMERSRQLTENLVRHLFDEELEVFIAFDALTGDFSRKRTVSGLIPIVVSAMPMHIVRKVVETATGEHFSVASSKSWGVPSYDLLASDFNVRLYWRGPSWLNTSWLVWRGLYDHGITKIADTLLENLIELVARSGCYEYFDPITANPHGSKDFSWTAALAIDLLESKKASAGSE